MTGLHIQFQMLFGERNQQVEWQREWFPGITLAALRAARDATRAEFERLQPDGEPFGLCPRTFAATVMDRDEAFAHIPAGLDRITFSYALFQKVKVAEGAYDDEPAKWTTLKADVFPDRTVTQ